MSDDSRPEWWPGNPYPARVFTMTEDELCALIPDAMMRTRIAGFLMREAWELASTACFEALEATKWRKHLQPVGGRPYALQETAHLVQWLYDHLGLDDQHIMQNSDIHDCVRKAMQELRDGGAA